MEWKYYFLGSERKEQQGEKVDFDELLGEKKDKSPDLFRKFSDTLLSQSIEEVDPLLEKNPETWIKAFSTSIFLISECIPSFLEKKTFKTIYSAIKNEAKKYSEFESLLTSRQFIFGCLPYLIIGFKAQKKGWSENGNNNIKNFLTTIKSLQSGASISSFLCAHRERDPIIVEEVDLLSLKIACDLIMGITENFEREKKPETILNIFQPDASPEGLSGVFPEIFLAYLNTNKLGELVFKLNEHFHKIEEFLKENYQERITISNLKDHKKRIHDNASIEFGEKWKNIQRLPYNGAENGENLLHDIVGITANKIKRLMPFYSSGLKISSEQVKKNTENAQKFAQVNPNVIEIIEEGVDDFAQTRTNVGKAIYETVFYSVWGQATRQNNEVIVGLERDHNLYQSMAISYGYFGEEFEYSTQHEFPALFARRNKDKKDKSISSMSFRQFWRLSEKQ